MRRIFLSVALAVTALLVPLLTATPALAKGISHGRLTGPGLSAPIKVVPGSRARDTRLNTLRTGTSAHAAVYAFMPKTFGSRRPPGRLGPCYRLEWYGPPGDTPVLLQFVYPYAARGPVVRTPKQKGAVQHGWVRAPAYTKDVLRELGLPKRAPAGGRTCP
ncbi:hypothetical protein [Nonomuraea longicatena]|uniref:Uncharacterized protein n=1 Tax=Nonomuraea longicatena TaxID=83682 RepID=A0ABN1PZ20_9ACTN